jgi:hypothetical protein
VRADDVNVGGCLLAAEVNDGRPGQVLMGIQTGEQLSPLANQRGTRDRVGLAAKEGAVVAPHGLVERGLYPAPLMVVEGEEKANDRVACLAPHQRSPSRPSSPSQPRTSPTASLT